MTGQDRETGQCNSRTGQGDRETERQDSIIVDRTRRQLLNGSNCPLIIMLFSRKVSSTSTITGTITVTVTGR